jgi:predicted GNAT family acetyltransferase
MRAVTVGSAQQFLAQTEQLRGEEPLLTNLIGTVAASVAAGRRYDTCFWWVVRDDADRVVGCACRTTPYPLVLSPMPPAAAAALAEQVALIDPAVPGVTGPGSVVDGLLAGLGPSRPHRVQLREFVKTLQAYVPPPPVPGRARLATRDQIDELIEWFEQFQHDAGLAARDPRPTVVTQVENQALTWWEVDGRPVALAGHAPVVDGIGRIGPVFTLAAHRRHGYGAAVTGAVVAALLPRCTTVLLFTDASNSTSNGVYERLGFVTVAEFVEVALE